MQCYSTRWETALDGRSVATCFPHSSLLFPRLLELDFRFALLLAFQHPGDLLIYIRLCFFLGQRLFRFGRESSGLRGDCGRCTAGVAAGHLPFHKLGESALGVGGEVFVGALLGNVAVG